MQKCYPRLLWDAIYISCVQNTTDLSKGLVNRRKITEALSIITFLNKEQEFPWGIYYREFLTISGGSG